MPSYKITFSFEILYIPDYLALCILQSFIHMFFKCVLPSRNLTGSLTLALIKDILVKHSYRFDLQIMLPKDKKMHIQQLT